MSPVLAVFYRDYRQRITNVAFVFWDLLAPLSYLLLFGIGFDRLVAGEAAATGLVDSYPAFLLPGVLAMVSFSVAMNTAWGFFMDKDSGIFYELLTYPITRAQFLVGKIGFSVLLSVVGSLLAIALGVAALGVGVAWPWLPLTLALVAASTASWFFLFSTFAIRLRRMDAFNTVTSAAYILLMFISPMFYPLDGLPVWFRAVAAVNPMTWQVDLLRFGLLGGAGGPALIVEAVALAAFVLAGLALAARTLNRAD